MLVGEFGQIAMDVYPFAQPGTVRVSDIFVIEGKKNKGANLVLRTGPKASVIQYG
jgi:hypothetical protein